MQLELIQKEGKFIELLKAEFMTNSYEITRQSGIFVDISVKPKLMLLGARM